MKTFQVIWLATVICSVAAATVPAMTAAKCDARMCEFRNHTHDHISPEEFKKIHDHPDPETCHDMTPKHYDCSNHTFNRDHSGCISPQKSTSPYKVQALYSDGCTVQVDISGAGFRAIYAQVRITGTDKVVGHWSPEQQTSFTLDCPNGKMDNNTIMFYSQNEVQNVQLKWVPPPGIHNVTAYATIAPSYEMFWVGQPSQWFRTSAEKCNNTNVKV